MAWDSRGYYYRSIRRGERVDREYLGTGLLADLAALEDEQALEDRILRRAAERVERERISALDEQVAELSRLTDGLVRVELQDAGYHQHDRGRWHRRRAVD